MNDQEIEDKIWENANEWIVKTKCCDKIATNKKRCFDIIKLMIPTQLKEKIEGNRIFIRRIDTTNRAEFDNSLVFQKNMLSLMRDELNRYPKPMFYDDGRHIIHYTPPLITKGMTKAEMRKRTKEFNNNPKFRKTFKIDEIIKVWKTKKTNVKRALENMRFYYTGFLILISRSQLQKSLGIISTKEANIRIKKCQTALEDHFKIMLKQNPKDNEAIRQFHEFGYMFKNPIYDLGKFRI